MGYAHNDLKPQNILLTNDRSPKICDFGSVKDIYASSTSSLHTNTRTNATYGTFGFEGTEICELDESKEKILDQRMGDIFSIGGILIFVFSVRLPFQSFAEKFKGKATSKLKPKQTSAWNEKSPYLPDEEIDHLKRCFIELKQATVGEKLN
jgi:serine/threonine protein kinase